MKKNFIMLLLLALVGFAAQAQPMVGDWIVGSMEDKLTMEKTGYVAKVGDDDVGNLLITQGKGVTSVTFLTSNYSGMGDVRVMYRIDDGPVMNEQWEGIQKTNVIKRNVTRAFLESLLTGKKIIIRMIDFEGDSTTDTFNLTDLREAMEVAKIDLTAL